MKRIIICFGIVLVVLGIYFVVSYFYNRSNIDNEITNEKNIQYDNDDIMAIMFIGGNKENYDYSLVKKYFDDDITNSIELSGNEKYLIIPRYDDMNIDIYELKLKENGEMDKKFILNTSGNFYLTCNESDIYSNVLMEINYNGQVYNYSPYISLKDGNLVTEDFVLYIKK